MIVNGLAEFDAYTEGAEAPVEESSAEETQVAEIEEEEVVEDPDPQVEEIDDEEEEEGGEEREETETSEDEAAPTEAQTIEALRKQLADALASTPGAPPVTKAETETPAEVKVETPVDVVPEYVTDATFDKMLEDPQAFNKLIHDAIQQGIAAQTQKIQLGAVETMQTAIPNIVAAQIAQQESLNKAAQSFYTEHAALEAYRPVVANNVNAIAAEHPDWTLDQIMPEAATRSYTQLQLNMRATEGVTNADPKTTGLRKGGKRGKKAPARDGEVDTRTQLQQEIDAL